MDVVKSKIMEDVTVKIKGGKIVSIGKSTLADLQEPGFTSFHMSGLYICPGLIDCEVDMS